MSLHAGRAAQRGQTQNERTQQRQMQSTQARQARLSRNRREEVDFAAVDVLCRAGGAARANTKRAHTTTACEVEEYCLVEYCQRCFGSEEPTDFAAVGRSGDVRI